MRDLHPIPFDNVQLHRLLASTLKYVDIVATGKEIEITEDIYKREIVLIAYKEPPLVHPHGDRLRYTLPVDDAEIRELATGEHDYVVYIERP